MVLNFKHVNTTSPRPNLSCENIAGPSDVLLTATAMMTIMGHVKISPKQASNRSTVRFITIFRHLKSDINEGPGTCQLATAHADLIRHERQTLKATSPHIDEERVHVSSSHMSLSRLIGQSQRRDHSGVLQARDEVAAFRSAGETCFNVSAQAIPRSGGTPFGSFST